MFKRAANLCWLLLLPPCIEASLGTASEPKSNQRCRRRPTKRIGEFSWRSDGHIRGQGESEGSRFHRTPLSLCSCAIVRLCDVWCGGLGVQLSGRSLPEGGNLVWRICGKRGHRKQHRSVHKEGVQVGRIYA